ncbi:MAG: PucR family transcriptional regulator [Geminicoccaceae bacterium]
MPDPQSDATLKQILKRLAKAGVTPDVATALDASMNEAGTALRELILAEIPAFMASGNPEVLPELDRHIGDHLLEIRRLIGGGKIVDFGFVLDQARLRAEQHFPLEATLHAYRCGHKVLARWMRDAATTAAPKNPEQAISTLADFAIEYTNTISTIATAAYVAQTRSLAEAEGDLRTELLSILLSGYDESDGRVARLLKRAGYLEQRQSYCVVVAQPVNVLEMENPARAQRIVNALSDALADTSIRTLVGIRHNLVTAVLSTRRRQSGWTPAHDGLAERLQAMLLVLGPAVLIGISTDQPSTSFVPKALQEATIALDFADVTKRVVPFTELPVRSLLVHRGADYVRAASPGWIDALVDADAEASGTLLQTLRAIADADMNIQKAARILGRHPNTIYHRIERIRDLTSLDGQRYHQLTELLLATDCRQS